MNRSIPHCLLALAALALNCASGAPPTQPSMRFTAARLTPAEQTAHAEAARQRRAAAQRAMFMLSPFGTVLSSTPESLPADPRVRTRAGLYLTRREAAQMDMLLGGDTVWIEPGCDGAKALTVAHDIVEGLRAAHDLSADTPVFVGGPEAHQAMRLADRLSGAGLTRVFLLTR